MHCLIATYYTPSNYYRPIKYVYGLVDQLLICSYRAIVAVGLNTSMLRPGWLYLAERTYFQHILILNLQVIIRKRLNVLTQSRSHWNDIVETGRLSSMIFWSRPYLWALQCKPSSTNPCSSNVCSCRKRLFMCVHHNLSWMRSVPGLPGQHEMPEDANLF